MIAVVLVDDHKIVRQGLSLLLEDEKDIKVVGEAASGQEGIELVEKLKPDVLISDLMLTGMSGLDVAHEVRKRVPGTKIIILTMYNDSGYVRRALKEGALGYILKGGGVEDLVRAVHAVIAGERYLSPGLDSGGKDGGRNSKQHAV